MLQSYPFLSILASIKTIFVVGFSLFCHATRLCPFAPLSSSPSPPYYISAVFPPLLQQHEYYANVCIKKSLLLPPQICFYLMKNIKFAFEIRQIKKQNLKKKKTYIQKINNLSERCKQHIETKLIRKIKDVRKTKDVRKSAYPKDKNRN